MWLASMNSPEKTSNQYSQSLRNLKRPVEVANSSFLFCAAAISSSTRRPTSFSPFKAFQSLLVGTAHSSAQQMPSMLAFPSKNPATWKAMMEKRQHPMITRRTFLSGIAWRFPLIGVSKTTLSDHIVSVANSMNAYPPIDMVAPKVWTSELTVSLNRRFAAGGAVMHATSMIPMGGRNWRNISTLIPRGLPLMSLPIQPDSSILSSPM
mmetsp:Transcript_7459/g.15509  ORF Transcript_7459/g.15509 Transcript_7459/m.15509 type:complete len:208 (-) Transcript_7459:278-901(-)